MYQARLHPEQYSNTFSDAQIKQLHKSMMYVCNTAVDNLADSDKFPADWLMKHRWDKGKKNGGKLPNGAKITFLKVGGRTSAVVPSVQKKLGTVAGDVSQSVDDEGDDDEEIKVKRGNKKSKVRGKNYSEESEPESLPRNNKRGRKSNAIEPVGTDEEEKAPLVKKQKMATGSKMRKGMKAGPELLKSEATNGIRRSSRLSKS